jgi:hypothetical protein
MFVEVWSQLVRGDYVKRPARLHGFTRRRVHSDVYPVIFPSHNGDWVDGFVYFGVGDEDLRRLDVFGRISTIARATRDRRWRSTSPTPVEDCYMHLVHHCEWDPQWFAREALPIFMHGYTGFARR